jgi:hypothetical protein
MPRFERLPPSAARRDALRQPAGLAVAVADRSPASIARLSSTIGNAAMRRLLQRESYLSAMDNDFSVNPSSGGSLPSTGGGSRIPEQPDGPASYLPGRDGGASIPQQPGGPASALPPTDELTEAGMPEMPEPGDLEGIIDYFAPSTDPLYSHSGCTSDFCAPFATQRKAWWFRFFAGPALEAAIAAHTVSPGVASLYLTHLKGGSSSPVSSWLLKNDFAQATATTHAVMMFAEHLREKYEQAPPTFPPGIDSIEVDLVQELPQEVKDLDDPASPRRMDFSHPGEAPSIVAGGIGKDQTQHLIGAQPSQQDDRRIASGKATVTKNPDGTLTIRVHAHFEVLDTVDMCPGNCGGTDEQIITRPLSWLEASGVSGDVPIRIEFDAPEQTATTRPKAPGGGGRNPFGG